MSLLLLLLWFCSLTQCSSKHQASFSEFMKRWFPVHIFFFFFHRSPPLLLLLFFSTFPPVYPTNGPVASSRPPLTKLFTGTRGSSCRAGSTVTGYSGVTTTCALRESFEEVASGDMVRSLWACCVGRILSGAFVELETPRNFSKA